MDALPRRRVRPADLDHRDRGRGRRPERDRDARRERGAVRARAAAPAPGPDRPRRHDASLRPVRRVRPRQPRGAGADRRDGGDHRRLRARRRGPAAARRGHALRRAAVGDARPKPGPAGGGRRAGRPRAGRGRSRCSRTTRGSPAIPSSSRSSAGGSRARSTGCSGPEPAGGAAATLPACASSPARRRATRLGPVPAGTRPVSDRAREGVFASLGGAGRGRAGPGPVRRDRRDGDRGALARRGRCPVRRRARRARWRRSATTWRATGLEGRVAALGCPACLCDPAAAPEDPYRPRLPGSAVRASARRTSTACLAALDEGWLARRRLDGGRDPRSEGLAACGSATLGRREAAPVRGQPPDPLPGGWMGLTALCPGTFDPVT